MVDHAAQYFSPAFRSLANHGGVSPRVFYWTASEDGSFDPGFGRHVKWNSDLYSGYQWNAPPAAADQKLAKIRYTHRALREFGPDAILSFGWSSPVALAGLHYGRRRRIPTLLYGDTNGRQKSTTTRGRLRGPVIQMLLRQVTGALSTGVANSQFYVDHGLSDERIHPGTLPIALDPFRAAGLARRSRYSEAATFRPVVIGFAGKLLPHKGADELIKAVSALPRDGSWRLQIVGDGAERQGLVSLVQRNSLDGLVEFAGFANSDEMPAILAAMDVFVMPSRKEPRGLVAIEAMAAGTVPVVSSATGVWGSGDAIEHGFTGFVYNSGDSRQLASILTRLAQDDDLRHQVAERARDRAKMFGPEVFADGVVRAVTELVAASSTTDGI